MATVEERLTAIEHKYVDLKHDNDELKKDVELHTIAIGALVNKGTLEKINEQNGKIFDALIAHDQFTNAQLAELRAKAEVDLEGKVVGMQTEMRQRFEQVEGKIIDVDGKVVGMQTEMRQRFGQVEGKIIDVDGKVVGMQTEMRQRFEQVENRFAGTESRIAGMESRISGVDGTVVGMQTEMRQRFEQVENRFAGMESRISGVEDKLEQILDLLAGQGPRS